MSTCSSSGTTWAHKSRSGQKWAKPWNPATAPTGALFPGIDGQATDFIQPLLLSPALSASVIPNPAQNCILYLFSTTLLSFIVEPRLQVPTYTDSALLCFHHINGHGSKHSSRIRHPNTSVYIYAHGKIHILFAKCLSLSEACERVVMFLEFRCLWILREKLCARPKNMVVLILPVSTDADVGLGHTFGWQCNRIPFILQIIISAMVTSYWKWIFPPAFLLTGCILGDWLLTAMFPGNLGSLCTSITLLSSQGEQNTGQKSSPHSPVAECGPRQEQEKQWTVARKDDGLDPGQGKQKPLMESQEPRDPKCVWWSILPQPKHTKAERLQRTCIAGCWDPSRDAGTQGARSWPDSLCDHRSWSRQHMWLGTHGHLPWPWASHLPPPPAASSHSTQTPPPGSKDSLNTRVQVRVMGQVIVSVCCTNKHGGLGRIIETSEIKGMVMM